MITPQIEMIDPNDINIKQGSFFAEYMGPFDNCTKHAVGIIKTRGMAKSRPDISSTNGRQSIPRDTPNAGKMVTKVTRISNITSTCLFLEFTKGLNRFRTVWHSIGYRKVVRRAKMVLVMAVNKSSSQ